MADDRKRGATPLLDSFYSVSRKRKPTTNPTDFSFIAPYEVKLGPLPKMPVQRRTYFPTHDQQLFLADELMMRGLPHDHLGKVKFVEGLDSDANWISRTALDDEKVKAVTQGSTIYVQPFKFDEVTSFDTDTPFEEIYHTADFRRGSEEDFYKRYAKGTVGAVLSGKHYYDGNSLESAAKTAAQEMLTNYTSNKRERWKR